MKHHIIGLTGFAGAGKDTVADLLVTHAGFRKVAFADALKAELVQAFCAEPIIFTRPEFKSMPMQELALSRCTERGYIDACLRAAAEAAADGPLEVNVELTRARTPRETMQLWGTAFRRGHDANYWTRIVAQRVHYLLTAGGERNVVITDCRFANEVDVLRRMGGRLWQVCRFGLNAGTTSEGAHVSATDGSLFAPDAVIQNMHDIRHLQQLVLGEFWALDAGLERVKVEITI